MTIEVTPPNTVSAEQVTAMVELACRAPSLHNSLPEFLAGYRNDIQ